MGKLDSIQVDNIAKSCIDCYKKLPKTGKPIENEWTVLSCVVKYEANTQHVEVVALGTGSKCIGASKLSPQGNILNDSHAEVIARRGFLLYLYNQIEYCLANTNSIFLNEKGKFKLKNNIEFIFYSSQLPCGDASIIPKVGDEEHFGEILRTQKRTADSDICDTEIKVIKSGDDIHRTGAKCLPDAAQDPKGPGSNYHLIGQVRTKPGRGDRTLSVSCSDKLARWVHLGIQGSLLDLLLYDPIYLTSFIFGNGSQFSEESLKRALLERSHEKRDSIRNITPDFYQCSVEFPHARKQNYFRPAAGSILWVNSKNIVLEVAIQGKKLGVTKKKSKTLASALSISKVKLYTKFQDVLNKSPETRLEILKEESSQNISYSAMKRKSQRYLDKWLHLKNKFFKIWTVKPDLWNFTIS